MPIRHYTAARALLLVTVVAGALAVGGCGADDSKPTSTTTSAATSTSAGETSGPRTPATVTVQVTDMKFSPANITVKAGDTVTWKFDDKAPHAVQGIGDVAMGINSPIFHKGEWSYTFTSPGTYRYLCPLHPDMKGTVTVEQ
ncbi:cupredoxin family copper-binding protein [Nocardia sp. 2]|uniref:Cupredoxin family copper-binding protein n=1 Tax=Nocardia acididurans TaxID=2802282 RepID=A0ABS1M4X2_9NOCA|nr:cupredoxin family copper-binding protein [Nocardia acididurans]MBL1075105.1 cupredoxin family copper-binding protein [Nocardia acididurans]